MSSKQIDRVSRNLDPRGQVIAVLLSVSFVVTTNPQGLRLDKRRTPSTSGPGNGFLHRLVDRNCVLTIDDHARHAVGGRPVGDVLRRTLLAKGRRNRPSV